MVALVGVTAVITIMGLTASWWLRNQGPSTLPAQSKAPIASDKTTGSKSISSAPQGAEAIPIGAAWARDESNGEAEGQATSSAPEVNE